MNSGELYGTPPVPDEKLREKIEPLKLLILDVDGVLTDGGVYIDGNGLESKRFNIRDAHGIKLALRAGLDVAILSGRSSASVNFFCEELCIKNVYQNAKNKLEVYDAIISDKKLEDREVAFMGDDVVDIPVLERVGFSASVADASPFVTSRVDYVSRNCGGHGGVREFMELVLAGSGRWNSVMERYF